MQMKAAVERFEIGKVPQFFHLDAFDADLLDERGEHGGV